MKYFFLFFSMIIFMLSDLFAQVETHSTREEVFTPERELEGFSVPEGFEVELVASERDGIVNPIDLTFDDAGRLWTQTARMYPLDPVKDIQWNDLLELMDDPEAQKKNPEFNKVLDLYEGKTKGEDNILVLSNLYNENPVQIEDFASGLAIPQSILPYKNGVFVAQGSELFFLKDGDNDGKADERIRLFTGFGITDSHTMAHSLIRGPGDWIYFSHGALNKGKVSSLKSDTELNINYSKIARFSPDGEEMELVSSGLNNIWGFQLRHNGQWYATEANDLGYAVVPMEPGTGFPGIGNGHLRPYQPWMPQLHEFRVGGTGLSGLAFSDDASGSSFPDEWNNVALLANPITSTINAVKVERNPDGSMNMEHLDDFLTSEDDFSRPVNMEFGPDGCLYIADWYNKIISHNELPTTHPDRDKSHGRIFRICHQSQKERTVPNFHEIDTADLPGYLTSPSLWEKRAAWHQISDRPAEETASLGDELAEIAGDKSQDEITRIHALWSLEGINHYNPELVSSLLESDLHNLRREAVRSLIHFSPGPSAIAEKLEGLIEDENPMVRSQVIRTLTDIKAANQSTIDILVRASKPEIEGDSLGGPYERKFERYLARKALEQYLEELETYLKSNAAEQIPVENLLWASLALPDNQKEEFFVELWPEANITKLQESDFIGIANMLNNEKIYELVKPVIHESGEEERYVKLSVQNISQLHADELSDMLRKPVKVLLQEDSEEDINLALDAIGRFDMKGFSDKIISLVDNEAPESTLNKALVALENNSNENQDFFICLFRDDELTFDMRLKALNSLIKTNYDKGITFVREWISELDESRVRELTNVLSTSGIGSKLLLQLFENDELDVDAFERSTAERIRNTHSSEPISLAIVEGVKKREQQESKALEKKLTAHMEAIEENEGNKENGRILFQSCLTCHAVGDEGQDIAPALDGSAYRDTEALLTAILDPNAAVESGYEVYRITKTDGDIVEGYLVEKNEQGTTIAFMGGNTVYINGEAIKSEGFVSGRSFMPEGLIENYSDQEVADLITYIRSLE